MTLVVYLLQNVTFLSSTVHTYNTTDAGDLEDFLKSGYYKTIRPEDQTDVGVSFGLMHISSLDIVTQQIRLTGFIILSWTDSRLQWTPSSHGNVNHTFMLRSDIWVPPLILNNAANGLMILSDDDNTASTYVTIYSNGLVFWGVPSTFDALCVVNIQYYPFDSQDCDIIITPWGFASAEINIYTSWTTINLDLYEENGEWDVFESEVTNHTRGVVGMTLSAAKFSLNLRRKYSYYLINLILPVILLAILGTFVFILPVESGEKNGFSLTILLSMSVMMTLVSDRIPPIATQTCQLSVYLLCVFIICSLETVVTVFACQIHAYTAKSYKPCKRLQRVTAFLAKISYFRRPSLVEKDEHVKTDEHNNQSEEKVVRRQSVWEDEQDNVKPEQLEFTYEEIAFICDRLNFIFFFGFTSILTLAFLISLYVGGTA